MVAAGRGPTRKPSRLRGRPSSQLPRRGSSRGMRSVIRGPMYHRLLPPNPPKKMRTCGGRAAAMRVSSGRGDWRWHGCDAEGASGLLAPLTMLSAASVSGRRLLQLQSPIGHEWLCASGGGSSGGCSGGGSLATQPRCLTAATPLLRCKARTLRPLCVHRGWALGDCAQSLARRGLPTCFAHRVDAGYSMLGTASRMAAKRASRK